MREVDKVVEEIIEITTGVETLQEEDLVDIEEKELLCSLGNVIIMVK